MIAAVLQLRWLLLRALAAHLAASAKDSVVEPIPGLNGLDQRVRRNIGDAADLR